MLAEVLAGERTNFVARRIGRLWRVRKLAATSSRSSMVWTSIQLSGTATTTSAKPKPSGVTVTIFSSGFGKLLVHQINAGHTEMHAAAGSSPAISDADRKATSTPSRPANAAIIARAATLADRQPARSKKQPSLLASGPWMGCRGSTCVAHGFIPRWAAIKPERRTHRRNTVSARRGFPSDHQTDHRITVGRRGKVIACAQLERKAGIVVEPSTGPAAEGHAFGHQRAIGKGV